MTKPLKYHNRDISWLSFNNRVLEEAKDPKLPLYERLKFLAIYSSNLDEFYKVRVALLKKLVKSGHAAKHKNDRKPEDILSEIYTVVDKQQNEFGETLWQELSSKLQKKKINLLSDSNFSRKHKAFMGDYFFEKVLPSLKPILLTNENTQPFLKDNEIYLAAKLLPNTSNSGVKYIYAIVNIPSDVLPRFIELPIIDEMRCIAFLDDVVKQNLHILFPGYKIRASYSIKISRDADLDIEDEFSGNLVKKISESLKNRDSGVPSRFLYDGTMPLDFLEYLKSVFNFSADDLVPGGKYHNLSNLFAFPNPFAPKLEEKKLPPLKSRELKKYKSMFEAIQAKDWMFHFPYQSFDPVIEFLNEAAIDPMVLEINATQYRVASNSAIISALINAAQNGKKVTVFVEVKARFDEYANINYAKLMKKAGIKILYSMPGLKVHAKIALVIRKDENNMKSEYAFLSTGNFNEKTARLYADHGLFTSNKLITKELIKVFYFLKKKGKNIAFKNLLVAQFNMKEELLQLIENEIKNAEKGKPAWLILKMNSLENKKMINKLYKASKAGVKIDLIVRGICCLVPGKKFSKNIKITRLIDRFLEHARVFVFCNSGQTKMYMASADWMNRNLNRRIEVGFPVYDPAIKDELMNILHLQLQDNVKARVLDAKHNNVPIQNESETMVRAQTEIYNYLKKQ